MYRLVGCVVFAAVLAVVPATSGQGKKPKAPTGEAAYDSFPEDQRPKLIEDWKKEIAAIEKAIKEDQERFARATSLAERQRLYKALTRYAQRLAELRINNPPYVVRDATPASQVLSVAGLKVGAKGRPESIDAKVMQVLPPDRLLLGLEDARTGKGRYATWVMLKGPSTAGIVDGKFWRGGQWKDVTGAEVFEVTGTTTYATTGGGTKTVFVLEPVKPAAKD